jgi:hypothetical protein
MLEKILLAVDMSDHSRKAVPAAAELGSRAASGRSAGPRSALDARHPDAVAAAARPRQRPVRGWVQGSSRGAEGEAVPRLEPTIEALRSRRRGSSAGAGC